MNTDVSSHVLGTYGEDLKKWKTNEWKEKIKGLIQKKKNVTQQMLTDHYYVC